MAIIGEKGIIPFSRGLDPSEMAYDCVRVLRYKGYLDWTRWKIDGLKEYIGEPRKWQVHSQELMDRWIERAEALKKTRESLGKNQKPVDVEIDDSQPQLTREFYEYYRSTQAEELEAFNYHLCTGKEMNRSKKKPTLYDQRGDSYTSNLSMYETEREGLYALIDFIEYILGGVVSQISS